MSFAVSLQTLGSPPRRDLCGARLGRVTSFKAFAAWHT